MPTSLARVAKLTQTIEGHFWGVVGPKGIDGSPCAWVTRKPDFIETLDVADFKIAKLSATWYAVDLLLANMSAVAERHLDDSSAEKIQRAR